MLNAPPTSNPDALLTYRQVAERLAVSERTVFSLIKAGSIPVAKIGRSVRVRPSDLQAYVAGLVTTTSGVRQDGQ